MAPFFASPWLIQYLVSGALSLFISMYILYRRPRTKALRILFIFGLVVSSWEIASFFHRASLNPDASALFFTVIIISSNLSLPLYLASVLSIRIEEKFPLTIVFVPAIINLIAYPFLHYEFFLTEFGWSYRIGETGLLFILFTLIYLGYLIAIVFFLFELTRRARSHQLKKKYMVLLASFVAFQVIGIPLTNYLLTSNSNFPPLGGVSNFLSFAFMGYAILIKEEKIALSISGEIKDFSTVYSSFLTVFFNFTTDASLGEESFKFLNFIRESEIENQVTLSEKKITFKKSKGLDITQLVNRNLNSLARNFRDTEIVDYYLRVLNAAHNTLGEEFESVVTANEDFLKNSDLIYGIAGGKFVETIVEDTSLNALDDVDACLKLYKRILLSVGHEILSSIDCRKRLAMYYATKKADITEYGEISLHDVGKSIIKVSKDELLPIIIESFNSFACWIYERVLTDPSVDSETILRRLSQVLKLNKSKAIELNVYHLFLERLVVKMPRTQIQRLYSEHLEELVEARTNQLKKAQERLLEAKRLAAIGETAAMIGHDLRNPLQTIFSSIYLARDKLRSSASLSERIQELKNLLDSINERADYMNKIVSDLQDYARPLKPDLVETNLEELITDVLTLTVVPENVEASVIIEEGLPKIPVDATLTKRVLTNLITNALQAMPNGGKLRISASSSGKAAFIVVEDTGVGIPEENLNKIFSPLFTTKSKGQGFGLAVCKRLVEAHRGKITVESKIGKGAKFAIELPREEKTQSQ